MNTEQKIARQVTRVERADDVTTYLTLVCGHIQRKKLAAEPGSDADQMLRLWHAVKEKNIPVYCDSCTE